MTKKLKPIFDSFQEYIKSEDMIFKTLHTQISSGTLGSKDIKVKG